MAWARFGERTVEAARTGNAGRVQARPKHLAGLLFERDEALCAVHRPRLGLQAIEHETRPSVTAWPG